MAVCGRCLICGYKFRGKDDETGTDLDAPIIAECDLCPPRDGEKREHKICQRCHDALAHHGVLDDAIADMLALVARRSHDEQPEPYAASRAELAKGLAHACGLVASYHEHVYPGARGAPKNEIVHLEMWRALAATVVPPSTPVPHQPGRTHPADVMSHLGSAHYRCNGLIADAERRCDDAGAAAWKAAQKAIEAAERALDDARAKQDWSMRPSKQR